MSLRLVAFVIGSKAANRRICQPGVDSHLGISLLNITLSSPMHDFLVEISDEWASFAPHGP